jgi:integrase
MAGLAVATGGRFRSDACDFVVADWRERARAQGATTKSGSQLVGASALYGFGFRVMAEANACPMRGIRAATLFRNGLILAVGAALPERARALTWLEFDRTLTLIDRTHIHVDLPGKALKYPEARKAREGYDVVFENRGLAEALHAYRADFRHIFDDGLHLFPSVHGKSGAITSKHLGRLTGALTEREFGVRIPIHRVRDNVATEASENLIGGAYAAKTLLRHVDDSVTRRHYDRSEGLKATDEFEDFIETRRKVTAELIL